MLRVKILEEIKKKINQHQTIPENRIVASGKDFVIRASDFVAYKANMKTMLESAENPFAMRYDELLRNMIQRELLAVYAKEKGIQVTDEEVRQAKRFKDEFIRAKAFTSAGCLLERSWHFADVQETASH